MSSKRLNPAQVFDLAQWQSTFVDDFYEYTDAKIWTKLASDSGASVAMATSTADHCGVVKLTTGGTNNNEAEIFTTNAVFNFLADQPLSLECLIKYSEANTDDANVGFGLCATTGANLLLDDGGGPSLGTDGCCIYKVDGETLWRAYSVVSSGTAKAHQSIKSSSTSHWQRLGIDIDPVSSTECHITYRVGSVTSPQGNDLLINDTTLKLPQKIKHVWDISGTVAEMSAFLYVKAGGSNSEVVSVDYAGWSFRRGAQ